MTEVLHLAEPIRVGSLVRWPEYPDRLYIVTEMLGIHARNMEYVKLKSIDGKYGAVVAVPELVLDDVDYIEIVE